MKILSRTDTMAAAARNTSVRIVANTVSWFQNAAILKQRRKKSWPPITNVRACVGSSVFSASAHKLWAPGLKKAKSNPALEATLAPAGPDDILELDEVWSFVLKKVVKRWLWTAMCRRARQIVAFMIGDRRKPRVVNCYGKLFQTSTKAVKPIVTSGKRMPTFSERNASLGWQGQRSNQSYGTLEQHPQTMECSLYSQNIVFFKDRLLSRVGYQAVYHPLQSQQAITCS